MTFFFTSDIPMRLSNCASLLSSFPNLFLKRFACLTTLSERFRFCIFTVVSSIYTVPDLKMNFPPLYVIDDDFYATLLQLGLEPVDSEHKQIQVSVETKDVGTQTEKPRGILWGYF